eukprot:365499-Chlamydomonas_euryale.AAC.2
MPVQRTLHRASPAVTTVPGSTAVTLTGSPISSWRELGEAGGWPSRPRGSAERRRKCAQGILAASCTAAWCATAWARRRRLRPLQFVCGAERGWSWLHA